MLHDLPWQRKCTYITASMVTVLVKSGNDGSYVLFTKSDAHNIALIGLFSLLVQMSFCSCSIQGSCRGEVWQGTGDSCSQSRRTHRDQVETLSAWVWQTRPHFLHCTLLYCDIRRGRYETRWNSGLRFSLGGFDETKGSIIFWWKATLRATDASGHKCAGVVVNKVAPNQECIVK